jgi:hypothetical protein
MRTHRTCKPWANIKTTIGNSSHVFLCCEWVYLWLLLTIHFLDLAFRINCFQDTVTAFPNSYSWSTVGSMKTSYKFLWHLPPCPFKCLNASTVTRLRYFRPWAGVDKWIGDFCFHTHAITVAWSDKWYFPHDVFSLLCQHRTKTFLFSYDYLRRIVKWTGTTHRLFSCYFPCKIKVNNGYRNPTQRACESRKASRGTSQGMNAGS